MIYYFNIKDCGDEIHFDKKFNIIKTLEEGSFGVVYLCNDKFSKELFAIKKSKKTQN